MGGLGVNGKKIDEWVEQQASINTACLKVIDRLKGRGVVCCLHRGKGRDLIRVLSVN